MRNRKILAGLALAVAVALVAASCGDSGGSDSSGESGNSQATTTSADQAAGGSTPEATTTSGPVPETTPATTAAPETTEAPEPEPDFVPAESIRLDDPRWALEPHGVSYRTTLLFTLAAELPDGTIQEGVVSADGGKLVDPVAHSIVAHANEFATIPDCLDLAALSPQFVSAYDTLYGGLSGEEGGDLTGDAQLLEAGIMSNGVLADRYEITLANVKPESADEYVSFDEAYIDIAREGQFVVSLMLVGVGLNNSFSIDQSQPRAITYALNFSEFGTYDEFVPPAACDQDAQALDLSGDTVVVNWSQTSPIFIPNAGSSGDPFFQIHTSNDIDGFFLSFELYTVWGEAWTGQTGTFEISCTDPTTSTGICVHFDPDGSGPAGDLGADFAATGFVTVNRLDSGGYDFVVDGLSFSDGTTFDSFTVQS